MVTTVLTLTESDTETETDIHVTKYLCKLSWINRDSQVTTVLTLTLTEADRQRQTAMLPSVYKLSSNNRDRQPGHHSFNSNRSRQTETDSQITTILTVTEADRQRFLEQQRQPARSPQERAGAGDSVVPRPPSRGGAAPERGRGGGGGGGGSRKEKVAGLVPGKRGEEHLQEN